MQIHFYDQWDKQSTKEAKPITRKSFTSLKRKFNQLRFFEGNRTNLLLIVVGITTAFIFSYLIFAGQDGQAVANQKVVKVVKPQEMLYTVQKGDTLWSIAGQHYPELSREAAIGKIQESNGFQGTTIHAGQTILLP